MTEKILRHVGFIRLDHVDTLSGALMMVPDVLMLTGVMTIFLVIQRSTREDAPCGSDPASGDAKNMPNLNNFAFLSSKSIPSGNKFSTCFL